MNKLSIRLFSHLGAAVLALALASGCAAANSKSYSAASAIGRPFGEEKPVPLQVTEEEIAKAFEARSQIRLPASIAIFEYALDADSWRGRIIEENENANGLRENLQRDANISKVIILQSSFESLHPVTSKRLRLAAAHHQADMVLLIRTDFELNVTPSPLSILNLTIIGAFIVPSTWLDLETKTAAHLFDTRNGYVYHSDLKIKRWEAFVPAGGSADLAEDQRRAMLAESCEEIVAEAKRVLARDGQASR